ncbi:magnesium/cobalt transporter CorA [Psychrosphaera haliotis]|uniref:magnesium transporter CorA family protein n=1 Tax=Psychrosphaera haliotis TaxID=555083 RepID=UPI0031CE78A0
MINCMLLDANGNTLFGGAELVEQWKSDTTCSIWIDLTGEEQKSEAKLLTSLGCHTLAITDAQRDRHPPKIELFKDYLFLLYRGIYKTQPGLIFEHLQISFFIGERIFISRHEKESTAINAMFTEAGAKYLKRSPIHLATRIFHHSCGLYLTELLDFETELENLEDQFQNKGSDSLMRDITTYRSRLVKLRRAFSYHVNIGKALASYIDDEDTQLITNKETHTINDLNERLDRLLSLSQLYYDICGDLVDGYLSVTSHQLNATMRVLTVITAVFVPLSFLAGLYGMNFDYIPELKVENGYFILIGVMLTIAVGLIGLFKKKNWL